MPKEEYTVHLAKMTDKDNLPIAVHPLERIP